MNGHGIIVRSVSLINSSSSESTVEGNGHPESTERAESGGSEGVFAGVFEDASDELGKATEEETKGVGHLAGDLLGERAVRTSSGGENRLCDKKRRKL